MVQAYNDWRLVTSGNIRHKLIKQSGRFSAEEATWTMVVMIRSQDLGAFLLEAFPIPIVAGGLIYYPRRWSPYGLPTLRLEDMAVDAMVDGIPIDPFGGDPHAPEGTYGEYLKLTLTFKTCPENDTEPDPSNPFTFLEISSTASGEFLTNEVHQDDVTWRDASATDEEPDETDTAVNQLVSATEVEWVCKWPQVPHSFFHDTLVPRMRAVMGRVNNAAMTLFADAPEETILFLGYSMTQEYTWRDGYTGASPVNVTLRFLEKNFQGRAKAAGSSVWGNVQVTHNHLWRPNHGWQRLLINSEPIYASANLTSIFG